MRDASSPLTTKQARFVAEYLKDQNGAQAAIRCGYAANSAKVTASKLLTIANVARAVAEGEARQLESADLTAISTLRAIKYQVTGDVRNLFDDQGNLVPIKQLSREDAALIAGFEVVIKNAAAGDGHTDTIHKVKLKDQARYVEMAAKHFGLLTERIDLQGEIKFSWLSEEA